MDVYYPCSSVFVFLYKWKTKKTENSVKFYATLVTDFIKKIADQENFIVASISSSPALLAKAGLLKNKKYTVGLLEEARINSGIFEAANYVNQLLVKDGNIITAWGSAFIDFGILFGKSLDLQFEEGWYGK